MIRRAQATVAALLAAAWVATASASAPVTRDPMTHFFEQTFHNLPEEVAAARTDGRMGIMVMFMDADCPWCAKMKANVLNRTDVQEFYRKHFRSLEVDVNGDVPITDFSGKEMSQKDFAFKLHRVRATPVFIFFGLDGKVLTRFTGATRDAQEFLWLGEFVASGAHANTNFAAYKRDRSAGGAAR